MELEAYTSCSDSSQNVFYSLILCEKITNEVVLRFGRLVLFFFLSDLVMCSFLCFFLSVMMVFMAPLAGMDNLGPVRPILDRFWTDAEAGISEYEYFLEFEL